MSVLLECTSGLRPKASSSFCSLKMLLLTLDPIERIHDQHFIIESKSCLSSRGFTLDESARCTHAARLTVPYRQVESGLVRQTFERVGCIVPALHTMHSLGLCVQEPLCKSPFKCCHLHAAACQMQDVSTSVSESISEVYFQRESCSHPHLLCSGLCRRTVSACELDFFQVELGWYMRGTQGHTQCILTNRPQGQGKYNPK